MSDEICEVVVTAPDEQWLVDFTKQLISADLAACGHHTEIRSVYRWRGEVHDTMETRVLLHTRRGLVPAIIEAVGDEHPYEVACVAALPILEADPAYQTWVLAETREG